ncbi:DUF2946 domain-containing protein [Pseudomonas sp. 5P_5.1_Bac1]|uniref:DUF2946 domain-containing protein n=1 Tax=Pseudomonas sp. 5P_5.1_Bac1 TaxID=2971616 RepID=UPI0021CA4A59|nr:DUF2946 domain-containing protein [Pseudomonas sp. 5P_5.1_Bac1]MCU1723934.1 DUF2946 domain-containing protein [Pseudomonas sp. 5P_5.1_Bac1]
MSLARTGRHRPPRPDHRTLRAGWLSLFAMLMIFIGPLVSQSMPMDHSTSMSMNMDMGAGTDDAAGHHGDAHHGGGDPSLHVLWEKCGYCSLFFHCPALPQQLSLLNSEAVPASHRLVVLPRQGHPRPTFFPGARSRAPPSRNVV